MRSTFQKYLTNMSLGNKRVLISDPIDPCCPTKLTEAGFTVDLKPGISKEDLTACIKVIAHYLLVAKCIHNSVLLQDYDGIIVRSGTKVTAEIIEAGTNLKAIGRAGTGVDNIDVNAASERGIAVIK